LKHRPVNVRLNGEHEWPRVADRGAMADPRERLGWSRTDFPIARMAGILFNATTGRELAGP
jgi:hypothetical protein